MAKFPKNPLKHLAGGFLLLSLHLGTLPTFAQTQAIPTAEQTAQLAEANRLNQQVTQLYQQGQYAAALPLAQKALAIREQLLGANHPDVATSLNNLALLYRNMENYSEALPLYQRALAIREQALGSNHPDVAVSLNNLAVLYRVMENYEEAEPLFQRSLAIKTQVLESNHPSIANSLTNLAGLYQDMGNYEKAEPLYQSSLGIFEQALGNNHPNVATVLQNLAGLYRDMGKYVEAESLYQRALAIYEQAFGNNHPHIVNSLNNLAGLYRDMGKYVEAEPLYQRALAIYEQAFGSNHPDVATALQNLAELYQDIGIYEKAGPLFQRSLTIREQALGDNHPDVAMSLNGLAVLYRVMGNYGEAESLYQRALAILEQELGSNHLGVAATFNNLAVLYETTGNYEEAESLYRRALAIREQELGNDHPDVANSLNNLAVLYKTVGNYEEAEPFYQKALAILEQKLGSSHPDVARSLSNLAGLYLDMGNYSEAEPLLRRALAINEEVLGSNHPDVAVSLNNLAALYQTMGNYNEALAFYQRSLTIREETLGRNHPSVATALNNLATVYEVTRNYEEAEPIFQRALDINEEVLGSDHPSVANSLNNLAALYRVMGNYSKAEPLLQRALTIREQALGGNHPSVANSLNQSAVLYQSMGNYSEAEPLYKRALAIYEQTLGGDHPLVALNFNNLAVLYQAQGDIASATDYLSRGLNIQENNLSLIFTTGSEAQKRAYMDTLSNTTHNAISLHLQNAPNNPEAANLALTTLLRRKGRILDALTDNVQLIRENLTPENQQLLDQLAATRTQLASLIYNKPENLNEEVYKTQVANLKAKANQLEAELSRRSAEFRTINQPVTIEAIQQQIPADAALVELMLYYPTGRAGTPRYAAYILHATGAPQWVDLGEAAPINEAAKALQESLASHGNLTRLQENARQLDSLLMQPIRVKLGNKTHILLSPDSQLNLIPFAALVDENDRYLVENYQITYLTTGRDLLRLANKQQPRQASVIVANPNYDEPGVNNSAVAFNRGSNQRSMDIADIRFNELPGTAKEAEAIKPLLPNATILTQSEATEQAIKQVEAPRILHIATHGFFLDVDLVAPTANLFDNRGPIASVRPRPGAEMQESAPRNQENPLLRSGLAMAGFNIRSSGGSEDGALTALEVAGLNLRGTQLVVLSACETGVGDVANGEGVYGLRRALAIAGAESQLISLWKVSDEGTKDLMVDYYQRLLSGEGRSDSLRQVQLAMLNSPNYQHPYFWASFIPSGEWAAME